MRQQYPNLNGLKDLVKPFLSKTSSNPELNKLFIEFKTNPDALFDFATNIQLLIQNEQMNGAFNKNALELGLITNIEPLSDERSRSKTIVANFNTPKSYEIEIKLNLIKGLLNNETMNKIKCAFGNDLLVDRLVILEEKKHNPNKNNVLLPTAKPELIDIDTLKKQAYDKQSKSTHNIKPKQTHYPKHNNMTNSKLQRQQGGFKIRNKTKKTIKSLPNAMIGGFIPETQSGLNGISPQLLSVKPGRKNKHKTRKRKQNKRW